MDDFISFFSLYKWQILSVILSLTSVFGFCHKINQYFGMPDDNPIEQDIEKIIKDESGIAVDLTPNSKEIDSGKQESESQDKKSDA